jgi:transcriptional regulator with GAF, ATPase, and Fis domain
MIALSGRTLAIPVPPLAGAARQSSLKLMDVERQHILSVLELTNWHVRGEHGAAARLGLRPTTLETRMAKLGLRRPQR